MRIDHTFFGLLIAPPLGQNHEPGSKNEPSSKLRNGYFLNEIGKGGVIE